MKQEINPMFLKNNLIFSNTQTYTTNLNNFTFNPARYTIIQKFKVVPNSNIPPSANNIAGSN